jgi:hypothetical protein
MGAEPESARPGEVSPGTVRTILRGSGSDEPGTGASAPRLRLNGADPFVPPTTGGYVPDESARQAPASVARGSGPIVPPRPDLPASISAELVVHGTAPAGAVLDLGGHDYRVGPGGRFSLRVPVRDPELVAAVLATVSELPVAPRDDAEDDAPR